MEVNQPLKVCWSGETSKICRTVALEGQDWTPPPYRMSWEWYCSCMWAGPGLPVCTYQAALHQHIITGRILKAEPMQYSSFEHWMLSREHSRSIHLMAFAKYAKPYPETNTTDPCLLQNSHEDLVNLYSLSNLSCRKGFNAHCCSLLVKFRFGISSQMNACNACKPAMNSAQQCIPLHCLPLSNYTPFYSHTFLL